MNRPWTTEVRAPGKLYIAGEYAVVEPGFPAVLIAVDRYVTLLLRGLYGASYLAVGLAATPGLVE